MFDSFVETVTMWFLPLISELQVVATARLRNFNMVNILCISSSFNTETYFTIFYRRTKICKTLGSLGNSFVLTRGLVTSISYYFLLRRLVNLLWYLNHETNQLL